MAGAGPISAGVHEGEFDAIASLAACARCGTPHQLRIGRIHRVADFNGHCGNDAAQRALHLRCIEQRHRMLEPIAAPAHALDCQPGPGDFTYAVPHRTARDAKRARNILAGVKSTVSKRT